MGRPKCQEEECFSFATYGFNDGRKVYCFKHKKIGMINNTSFKCLTTDCQKYASFGFDGGKKVACAKHKEKGMIDLVTSKCKLCRKNASYGYPNGKREYCAEHKLNDMINKCVVHCKAPDCREIAFFGYENGEREFCENHKLADMINKQHNKCIVIGCNSTAKYTLPDKMKNEYCQLHKPEKGILFVSCNYPNCNNSPFFGEIGGKRKFCFLHRSDTMINLSHKKCAEEKCTKRANYGYQNIKEYCGLHKKPDMINISKNSSKKRKMITENFVKNKTIRYE